MILESAILNVIPGQGPDFESAFGEAGAIIAAMPGFISLQLHRCIEEPGRYLLLVQWQSLEDHTEASASPPTIDVTVALNHPNPMIRRRAAERSTQRPLSTQKPST